MTASSKLPLVQALILTYNDCEVVSSCIETVRRSDYPNMRVAVIDNGSRHEFKAKLRCMCAGIDLIEMPENYGYSGAFNRAIKMCISEGGNAAYYWILNNDLEVAGNALSILVSAMEADPSVGFAGPETFKRGASGVHDQWVTRRGSDRNPAMIEFDNEITTAGRSRIEVEYVVGHCMLVRDEVIKKVGILRNFFIYFEEIEWQWRAKKSGWSSIAVPGAIAYHDRNSYENPFNTYLRTRNQLFFNRVLLAGEPAFGRCYARNLFSLLREGFSCFFRGIYNRNHMQSFIKGFVHGLAWKVPDFDRVD